MYDVKLHFFKNEIKFTVGNKILGIIFLILGTIGFLALDWIIICGVLKLITLCFNWPFTLQAATGVWLIILLLREIVCAGSK